MIGKRLLLIWEVEHLLKCWGWFVSAYFWTTNKGNSQTLCCCPPYYLLSSVTAYTFMKCCHHRWWWTNDLNQPRSLTYCSSSVIQHFRKRTEIPCFKNPYITLIELYKVLLLLSGKKKLVCFDFAGIFILDTEVRNLLENTFQHQHDYLLNEYRVFFSYLTDKCQRYVIRRVLGGLIVGEGSKTKICSDKNL
jgi:hypothetical protein